MGVVGEFGGESWEVGLRFDLYQRCHPHFRAGTERDCRRRIEQLRDPELTKDIEEWT